MDENLDSNAFADAGSQGDSGNEQTHPIEFGGECGKANRKAQAPKSGGSAVTRRTFAIGLGSTIALLGFGSLRYVGSTPVVRPPGGEDDDALVAKCIHCYRCVEACPYRLIVPTSIEAGIMNMRTPHMDFSDNNPGVLEALKYCDFCARANGGIPLCVEACPTDALDARGGIDAGSSIIGTAAIDTNLCLAYRGARCAFCYDACRIARGDDACAIYYRGDTAAEASDGSTLLPLVDAAKCNGCGACESVCVSAQAGSTRDSSVRAITVVPLEG